MSTTLDHNRVQRTLLLPFVNLPFHGSIEYEHNLFEWSRRKTIGGKASISDVGTVWRDLTYQRTEWIATDTTYHNCWKNVQRTDHDFE
ncbi:hypothetical protein ACHAXH_007030 [Discostella pseudostelligera]